MITECTMREFVQYLKLEDPYHNDIWEIETPDGWRVLEQIKRGEILEEYTFFYLTTEEKDYDDFYPHDLIRYCRTKVYESDGLLNDQLLSPIGERDGNPTSALKSRARPSSWGVSYRASSPPRIGTGLSTSVS